jgi:hypothetical protein
MCAKIEFGVKVEPKVSPDVGRRNGDITRGGGKRNWERGKGRKPRGKDNKFSFGGFEP